VLNADGSTAAALRHLAIDEINPRTIFAQPNLKVGAGCVGPEVHGAPLNIKDAVRRSAGSRSEDAAAYASVSRAACTHLIGSQVVPMRHDRKVESSCRQRANIREKSAIADEL
jgi:hypothetical protein